MISGRYSKFYTALLVTIASLIDNLYAKHPDWSKTLALAATAIAVYLIPNVPFRFINFRALMRSRKNPPPPQPTIKVPPASP